VRGDSLRDLYAKTLALLGLGVLAGAGALVDYWPIGVNVPEANSALGRPALALPFPVSSDAFNRVSAPAPLRAHQETALLASAILPVATIAALPVTGTSASGLGEPVGLFEPVTRKALAVTSASFETALFNPEVYEPFSPVATDEGVPLPSSIAPSAPVGLSDSGDDTDGFIAGAFKRTGNSIVKTSVKTGASIVDAVRVIGGAVRRALPN
jgi:hypothetical protein